MLLVEQICPTIVTKYSCCTSVSSCGLLFLVCLVVSGLVYEPRLQIHNTHRYSTSVPSGDFTENVCLFSHKTTVDTVTGSASDLVLSVLFAAGLLQRLLFRL